MCLRATIALVSNAKLQNGRTALRASIVKVETGCDEVNALLIACHHLGEELASPV